MNIEKQLTRSIQGRLVIFVLIFFIIFGKYCGESNKEQQTENVKDKEISQKSPTEILYDQVLEKYKAVSFPPKDLGENVLTYQFQNFLYDNIERSILFKGYLEDIEKTNDGIIAEFVCPLGYNRFLISSFNETFFRFLLKITDEKADEFVSINQLDVSSSSFGNINKSNYLIIAKITNLKKSRWYEFEGSSEGDDTEIFVEGIYTSFLATGELIEAIYLK